MPKRQDENEKTKPASTKSATLKEGSASTRKRRKKPKSLPVVRQKDPMLAREQSRYDYPLPSREYILQIMQDHGRPIAPKALSAFLKIEENEENAFQARLRAMSRDGQVMFNRRGMLIIPDSAGLMEGKVIGHRDGYGFFSPSDGSGDLYLPEKEMRKVLNGDHVLVRRLPEDAYHRPAAKIVEVTKRSNKTVVGRLLVERKVWFLIPEDKSMPQMVVSPEDSRKTRKWQNGLFVTATILEQPKVDAPPLVKVHELLGDAAAPGIEVEVSIRKYELPFEFSKAVKKLADNRAKPLKPKDYKGRKDLRELPLVTIDGETARDFDDAVYAEAHEEGYRLIVAIADVSHYVHLDDALDQEAYERGNSVYFPAHVLPMLPESLSNGMCSLNPDEDRLAMVCEMQLDKQANINKYLFYPAVIRSHARLTYETVYQFLYEDDQTLIVDSEVILSLKALKDVYEALLIARKQRGSIDFEIPETQIVFGSNRKIESIVPTSRNDAHRLIEECMLAANVCTALFLIEHHSLGVYRVHEPPHPDKLEELRTQLKAFGLPLGGGNSPTPGDFAKALEAIQAHPTLNWMQMLMLRSLQQAIYSVEEGGHFALGYPAYTHFTSPIRRYPDLIVHRLIKAILNRSTENYGAKALRSIAEHCSMTERRADSATRDAVSWLKCEYMQDKIGMIFNGTISSVVSFGVFVLLDNLYVEGLVHVSELGKDYFEFDGHRCRMIGQRSGFEYRVGDRVTVRLANVNLDRKQIDFVLMQFPSVKRPKQDTLFGTETPPVLSGALREKEKAPNARPNKPKNSRKSTGKAKRRR